MDAKVRTQYTNTDIFATAHQVLFNVPSEIRLKKSSRDKRHWLSLVAYYHPSTKARRHGNQPLITQFFGAAITEHHLCLAHTNKFQYIIRSTDLRAPQVARISASFHLKPVSFHLLPRPTDAEMGSGHPLLSLIS
jgi:hypothetical protein